MFGSAVLSLISQDRARLQRWCKVSSSLWNLLTVTSLHVCCGPHSECREAAPGILPNPDHQSVLFMCAYELSLRSPSCPQNSSLQRKAAVPSVHPHFRGPRLRTWSPSWIHNPPPLNLFKWPAAGLSLSLWDMLLCSDWSSSPGSLCPALRKIAFATQRQTSNEPGKLSLKRLVGSFIFSSYFLNDGQNDGKKNVALKYAKMCKS